MKFNKILLTIVLTGSIIGLVLLAYNNMISHSKITELERNQDELNHLISDRETAIEGFKNENTKLNSQNEVLKGSVEELEGIIKEMESTISKIEKSKSEIGTQFDVLNQPIVFPFDDPVGFTYFSQVKDGDWIKFKPYLYETSLDHISGYIQSFVKLTELTKASLSENQISEIGNLDWSDQVIGSHNFLVDLRGGIQDSRLLLAKSNYELAIYKYMNEEIDEETLNVYKDLFSEEKLAYENFIKDATYGD
ncbi:MULTISPECIES: hypothetical protein [unclassified Fusibacter]|uniref:hypothetical protein n=1 Tax=unclassified Fusibacter TaxID=2624464 RepID=UPI0010131DCB|nr:MULTISPECIES: hypothetical protein [unclassified Fusibacter]MCK8060284.1 hypothetical protein [Fusibacter sp. A2]NPE20427.1 hypothetical protein [Fusibacter sp. A1]RXV63632.1 hypothetical protein DWB64_01255 [Fusibacter sp. A1]